MLVTRRCVRSAGARPRRPRAGLKRREVSAPRGRDAQSRKPHPPSSKPHLGHVRGPPFSRYPRPTASAGGPDRCAPVRAYRAVSTWYGSVAHACEPGTQALRARARARETLVRLPSTFASFCSTATCSLDRRLASSVRDGIAIESGGKGADVVGVAVRSVVCTWQRQRRRPHTRGGFALVPIVSLKN